MQTTDQHIVVATMIVARIPGAQGGESYLRKDDVLPSSVTKTELARLTELGLVEIVRVVDVDAVAAERAAAIEREKAGRAAAEKARFDEAVRVAAEKLVAEIPAAIVQREDGTEVPVGEDGLQILGAPESDAASAAKPARRTAK